jgi:hypothetical protein
MGWDDGEINLETEGEISTVSFVAAVCNASAISLPFLLLTNDCPRNKTPLPESVLP